MKIAIIDIGWKKINALNPTADALGGSETWLIQIANTFAKEHDVDVYFNTNVKRIQVHEHLTYIHEKEFLKDKHAYDFIILNRFFEKEGVNYIEFIKNHNLAKHVYIQIHDLSFVIDGTLLNEGEDVNKYSLNDDFVTIVTLNEWHRKNLLAQYHSITKLPICIPNGLDLSLFKDEKLQRDNHILWSSCAERGLNILVNDIYPIVKQEIPDFGIDVAGYNNNVVIDTEYDVVYLGRLSKQELYHEQQKHKVWFYPGTFAETFCITMLEHIMNGAEVVSPFTYGTAPTIGQDGYEKLAMKYRFNRTQEEYDLAVQEAAQKIIEILKSTKKQPKIYEQIKNRIKEMYNWSYSVGLYLDDYTQNKYDEFKHEIKSKNKILILTMACNEPYFRALLAAERDTWVKPVLNGKYEDVDWFAYTACDKKHPVPEIDFDNHMIYVDAEDGIYHTYEKTQKAYNMLKQAGIQFDYIVRTNTSIYINVPKLIDKINRTSDDEFLGEMVGYYHMTNGKVEFQWNIIAGLFIGMKKEYFDIAMSATNSYDRIPCTDDVIISGKLHEVFGEFKCTSPNSDTSMLYPRYKAYQPGDEHILEKDAGVVGKFVDDPNVINNNVIVQLRPAYGNIPERSEKGHELEHFYELYFAENQ